MKYPIPTLSSLMALSLAAQLAAQSQNPVVLVLSGDAAGTNGTFETISPPSLSANGEVAFFANLAGTTGGDADDTAIFKTAQRGSVVEIARESNPAPDGNGILFKLNDFGNPAINDRGQVAFGVQIDEQSEFFPVYGLIISGGGSPSFLMRGEDPIAGVNESLRGTFFENPSLNDSGLGSANWRVLGSGTGRIEKSGIFIGTGSGTVTKIVLGDEVSPIGGFFSEFSSSTFNNLSQVAFTAKTSATLGGPDTGDALYIGDANSVASILKIGDVPPEGNGAFDFFLGVPRINDLGQVAAHVHVGGSAGGIEDDAGIYRGDANGYVTIVREGSPTPDGNGTFSELRSLDLNNKGQVAFNSDGIYRGDGTEINGTKVIDQIARDGDLAPDGNGRFSSFENPAINSLGQVAFKGYLSETNLGDSDAQGIYFYDDVEGLLTAVRLGDTLLSSVITGLIFQPGNTGNDNIASSEERGGFSDTGQVAFHFTLESGHQGIGIWTPPTFQPPTNISRIRIRTGPIGNTITWSVSPAGAGVDVYRSEDLMNWILINVNNISGIYIDSAPTVPNAFYSIVPTGASFP